MKPEAAAESISLRQERLAVIALALSCFGIALNTNVFAALAPFLDEAIGVTSKVEKGWLLSSAGLAGAFSALALGPLIDRFGRRRPLIWGSVLFVIASLGHFWVTGPESFFVFRGLAGLAGGIVFTSASAAMADLVPYERRAAAMGIMTASIFLAVPVGMPLANLCADGGFWRGIYVLQALSALAAMVLMMRFLPSKLGKQEALVSQWSVLRQAMVVPALLSVLLYTGAFFTAVQFAGEWLNETEILPKESQKSMWVILGLASAGGSLLLTRYADRIGKRRFVLLTTAGVGLCLLALGQVESITGLFLVGLPLSLISAPRSGALMALVSQIVEPRMRGTLMGIRAAAVNLGMGAFAGLGGIIYAGQDFTGLLMAAALAVALAFLLVLLCIRERS
ncbi:MAG: MFS transporter [Planctomycetota bacterium]